MPELVYDPDKAGDRTYRNGEGVEITTFVSQCGEVLVSVELWEQMLGRHGYKRVDVVG